MSVWKGGEGGGVRGGIVAVMECVGWCVRACACVRVRAYVLACACVRVRACACGCVRACLLACVRACVCV